MKTYRNPWAKRWARMGGRSDDAYMHKVEADDAEDRWTETCGACGAEAFYRPGVGAWQCPDCRAVRTGRVNQDTGEVTVTWS